MHLILDVGSCAVEGNCSKSSPFLQLQEGSSDEGGGTSREASCDNLIICIITTLNKGLRSGGGIGDVLRPPSRQVSNSLYAKETHNYSIEALALADASTYFMTVSIDFYSMRGVSLGFSDIQNNKLYTHLFV